MTIKYEYIDKKVTIFNLSNYQLIKVKCSIDDLKFNPYNDRFAMESSEYQIEYKKKLGLDEESQKHIYNLLWNSNIAKNKKTKADILEKGVLKDIVIDKNGIILDGNRRVTILRKLVEERIKLKLSNEKVEGFKNLQLVMINQELSKNEIRKVETILQISEDEKLDYDPINLYLKINRLCQEILNNSPKVKPKNVYEEISQLLGPKYSAKDVQARYETFEIMKEFLRHIEQPHQYTYLRNKEDHFKQIKSFQGLLNRHKIELHNFENDDYEENIADIKDILFDLTSAHVEGKLFRRLVPLSKKTSSPLLFGPGTKKIRNYIDHKLKDTNGVVKYYQNSRPIIDSAIKNIAEHVARFKEKENHIAATKNIFENIKQNIINLNYWNKNLKKPYQCVKKIESTIYGFIENLKKIVREYKENDED